MGLRLFLIDLKTSSNSTSIWTNLKWLIFNHSMHMLFLFRFGQDLYKVPFIGRIFGFIVEYLIRVVYSSDISCRARVGFGFNIQHGHDIVIGADVIIGENCKIFNGVTLGNKDISKSSLGNQPVVGNNVVLSTGAKILGHITIGDNVIVGANSVVIKNCPPNTIVAGVPSKIVRVLE